MHYVTPAGGSSVSCDPIGLVRGAPHRELAVRFIGGDWLRIS
jgi:ABC-type Fe3+ transport system substrate-binding protein